LNLLDIDSDIYTRISMKEDEFHTHDVEFINWLVRVGLPHRHAYSTETSMNQGHRHLIRGVTSINPVGLDNHVHSYEGETSFVDGHVHYYRGVTDPAIPLPGGRHIHQFAGETAFADGHIHFYRGRTGRGY
jgi:hypothetical protein